MMGVYYIIDNFLLEFEMSFCVLVDLNDYLLDWLKCI